MEPLVTTRVIRCKSARGPLWTALADTNRLNQAIGNSVLEAQPTDSGASRYVVRTKLAGLNLEYEELPFEWSEPDYLSISRLFRNGPARSYTFALRFTEVDDDTDVALTISVMPRSALLWPFLRVNTARATSRLAKEIRSIDANLALGVDPYTSGRRSPVNTSAFDRARTSLLGALTDQRAEAAERLLTYVVEAPDISVGRMRPYEIADEWSMSRRDVLAVCLEGVLAGLLELSWDIICPSCRTVADQLATLSELSDEAHCHFCDISISVELDKAVEATFRPAAAVRDPDDGPYCIGGPFRTPHVVAQVHLLAGETATLRVPEETGRYRLFVRGGSSVSLEVQDDGEQSVAVTAGETAEPARALVLPGASIEVTDALARDRHVKLEHILWGSIAATAHDVSMVDSFRRLFSAEVLRPGLLVKVTRVSFLFTDLKGSTALYTRSGDATAYRFVQGHFDVLREVIDQRRGAVVKTIGDAIMATFADEADAVRAAIAMQQTYSDYVAAWDDASDVTMRVGVYSGPCYSVNANGLMDYFGQTVNIADRLQSLSVGGEIVLPADMADHGADQGWLEGAHISERFDADLKGLETPLPAARLSMDDA